jgi:hypothetical protein
VKAHDAIDHSAMLPIREAPSGSRARSAS